METGSGWEHVDDSIWRVIDFGTGPFPIFFFVRLLKECGIVDDDMDVQEKATLIVDNKDLYAWVEGA